MDSDQTEDKKEENSPKVEEIFNERLTQRKPNKYKLLPLALVVLVIIAVVVGLKIFKSKKSDSVQKEPAVSQTPSIIPTPGLNPLVRSEWSFEVLNGSGVTGAAKKVADKLKEMGYQVVKVGNAEKDDYNSSQIFISSTFKDKVDLLVADIKDAIKIASIAGELKDSSASARIIIGKD